MKTLFEAIESADAGAVWKLVQEGASMAVIDDATKLTPLAIAAEAGLAEIVRILLEAGADPNFGGATTPLEAAVVEGHLEVVEALLSSSVDVNQKVEEGFTPLMTAASTGNLPLVKKLLEAGARPRLLNDDRESAVSLAERAGHADIVEELKLAARRQRAAREQTKAMESGNGSDLTARAERKEEAQADDKVEAPEDHEEKAQEDDKVEAQEDDKKVAAEAAEETEVVDSEDPVEAEEPLSILVDAEAEDADGDTDIFAPVDDDPAEPAELPVTALEEPSSDELFAVPDEILSQPLTTDGGSSPEPEPPHYDVADDFSVSLGDFEDILSRYREHVEAGSVSEIQQLVAEHREFADDAGRTLLMAAAYQGEKELVQALIAAGVEVDAYDRTESGQSALVYAVRSLAVDRLEIIISLVDAGADVNQRCGRNSRSPLMYAADADVYLDRPPEPTFAQTTKELIRLGANLEARDRRGRTVWRLIKRDAIGAPTFSACRRRLHQMLRVLEYNGAEQIASHRM